MVDPADRNESLDADERDEAKHGRGAMDPGLKEQFERDRPVVRRSPSDTPKADALQRPHGDVADDTSRDAER